ncbi:MAG: SIS domain-containing protein [Candidatus Cloacimonetes bacterium]|jgi:glucosamine 6-phosphate synthetase-like amidotransferase/phosphosugar isomerase protein|nr:SIS domain-containing protein [Candidatus Cloacimonadota bacterium]MDD4155546.1 SIS domain-containing protein [Candidatus Cloacimonadota bacterium]
MKKFVNKFKNYKITLKIPIFGIGCGVLGLHLQKTSINIGKYASDLLKSLEYRGYDSTGAAIQEEDSTEITLLKDVGAPSTLVETLGIIHQKGKIFCGQVRWATFGQVNKINAQPHIVKCKRYIYGAHNGNITNTTELKNFLVREGHTVLSDNDGEMLVHMIEHYFDINLGKKAKELENDIETRRECMRNAIIAAADEIDGSYAAVIVDPITQYSYAIKAGSSLYFATGTIENQNFCLASSDLTAVLKYTKMLIKLREGEFVEYNADEYQVYALKNQTIKKLNQPDLIFTAGQIVESLPTRSKLRAEDTQLLPEYDFFMEQEIHQQTESVGKLVKLFSGGSNTGRRMKKFIECVGLYDNIKELCDTILTKSEIKDQEALFNQYIMSNDATLMLEKCQSKYPQIYEELVKENFERKYFFSSEMNLFIDLLGNQFNKKKLLLSKAFDTIVELNDSEDFQLKVNDFLEIVHNTIKNNRNIYTLACGTSYHATKIAALFFNEIAGIEIIPILPGDFRGQYSNSLKDNDVIIGVSQSGETKDLVDIFNDIDKKNLQVKKVVLVNNINSTLGQEKSDVFIPILCGPEIAVPATKSFMNQMVLFYYLAIRVAELNAEIMETNKVPKDIIKKYKVGILKRYKQLQDIPTLIKETIATTDEQIDFIADKIFMEPSLHILATKISGVAMEGSLKIRETVLNHTQGMEASEFKHGPNTILGKNTVVGIKNIKSMIKYFQKVMMDIYNKSSEKNLPEDEKQEIIMALSDYLFNKTTPFNLSREGTNIFKEVVKEYDFFGPLYRNYPLIYITGPEDRDVNLTISQINTHKIRGADTFVIAEENDNLVENARKNPNSEKYYGYAYVFLPKTGDTLLTCFSATVVLQLLGLKMSIKKMNYLNKLNFEGHGVHPDVPKNVSKSITVD